MLIAMRRRAGGGPHHAVDTESQAALCGRSDMGLVVTGKRDVTCAKCKAALEARQAQ